MDSAVRHVDVATLVTGDRVRLTTYSDGRTSAVLLPGSPHLGAPIKTISAGGATYVVPRLAFQQQRRYDVSLFDVSALAELSGEAVPVTLTFAPGVTPHGVPSLTIDAATAHTSADGSVTLRATYDVAHRAATTTGSWRGVSSVALRAGAEAPTGTGSTMHTLTIHVVNVQGEPVKSEIASVQNVDDATAFSDEVEIEDGVGSISVPEGNYAVIAGSFTRTVIAPDFAVDDDTSISMDLADATVRAAERVPSYGTVDASVGIQRDAARNGGLGVILESDRFIFHVQPVAAELPHGRLHTSVNGIHAPEDELPPSPRPFSTLAHTKDFSAGVADDLSFIHPRSDFAIVPQKFYANGPAGVRSADVIAFAPFESIAFGVVLPVRVPSLRTVWLQGSDQLVWVQDYMPTAFFGARPATLTKVSRYTAGNALPVSFAHGPVGPGVEAAYDGNRLGRSCQLCRVDNRLHGLMPLFSGAGTAMSGLLEAPEMGSWALKRDDDVLDSGAFVLAPDVELPASRHRYTLEASSHPGAKSWQLSTDVTDVWTFASAAGTGVVPLLMPSYVPRVALDGSLDAGPTRFPLDFGNLGPIDARVDSATVELSTDGGRHWTTAKLTRVDANSFAVTYVNPAASASRHTMSLRVSGVDAAGRTVTETALDVYRLA